MVYLWTMNVSWRFHTSRQCSMSSRKKIILIIWVNLSHFEYREECWVYLNRKTTWNFGFIYNHKYDKCVKSQKRKVFAIFSFDFLCLFCCLLFVEVKFIISHHQVNTFNPSNKLQKCWHCKVDILWVKGQYKFSHFSSLIL